jgi:hypothetical protein
MSSIGEAGQMKQPSARALEGVGEEARTGGGEHLKAKAPGSWPNPRWQTRPDDGQGLTTALT